MNEEITAFTIRTPRELSDQINARAKLNHRSRNAEINMLLEDGIDRSVQQDLDVLKKTSDRSQT